MLNAVLVGVTILVIVGFALIFYIAVKVTPEESFASAVMAILILIYLTGLAGNTKTALGLIYLLAFIGIIFGTASWVQKKEYSIKTFFSPGIVMILGIACVGIISFDGMQICNWDELYQWGKAADYMVQFDKLAGGSGFSGESVLLSSTTFFHYFIARLSAAVMGEALGSNYYVSNLVLWFSALLLPFSGAGWKDWKRVWGFGLFHFLVAAVIFVQPYYNIYTDQATAYWAGGMIAWLFLRKCNRRNIYLLPLVLVNVGLMKSMVGPLFAVIVILSAAILYGVERHTKGQRFLPEGWKKNLFSRKGIVGITAVLSPFILMGVWSVIIGQNGLLRMNTFLETGWKNRAVLTLKSMIAWIFDSVTLQDDRVYLSYGLFILVTTAFVYAICPVLLDKEECPGYRRLMRVYIVGFAGYFFIMFTAYMLVFPYLDSVRAISLNRYYSDYMMLGMVPLSVPLFKRSRSEKNTQVVLLKKIIIFAVMFFALYGSSDYFLQNLSHAYAVDTKKYSEREKITEYAQKAKELTNGTGKIYFVNQKKSGLFTLAADYEMGEQVMRGGMCFKFRSDVSQKISGLTDYPIETLPEVLVEQEYEYLWVYSTDDYFKGKMRELFGLEEVKKGSFYKVVNSGQGVGLEYMGRIR